MMMRFREEYAVEWISSATANVVTTNPISDRQIALWSARFLRQRGQAARLISRTVREEKPWYGLFWQVTGVSGWFDGEEIDAVDANTYSRGTDTDQKEPR